MGPILIFLAREPHVHGYETLQNVIDKADAIVDRIHQAKKDGVDGIAINHLDSKGDNDCFQKLTCITTGAYTHASPLQFGMLYWVSTSFHRAPHI